MTYFLASAHPETLKSGRMIAPGQGVSDKEAQKNPRLIERGVLTAGPADHEEAPTPPDPAASTDTGSSAGQAPESSEAGKTETSPPESPEAKETTPPRPSKRTKAPASSSVPTKEDQQK